VLSGQGAVACIIVGPSSARTIVGYRNLHVFLPMPQRRSVRNRISASKKHSVDRREGTASIPVAPNEPERIKYTCECEHKGKGEDQG
jgi:hypothetical protein